MDNCGYYSGCRGNSASPTGKIFGIKMSARGGSAEGFAQAGGFSEREPGTGRVAILCCSEATEVAKDSKKKTASESLTF